MLISMNWRKDCEMNSENPILTIDTLKMYSEKYDIPFTDVMLIALNRYGLCANITDKRLRFKLKPSTCTMFFYLAVCVNTYDSPFTINDNNILCMNGEELGRIFDIEKDTCDATYFRRDKTELTLNSNMRSQCKGCTFCGTYNLDPDDRVDMSTDEKIAEFIQGYLKINNMKDLSNLVRVTICTGCFFNEMQLVEHIISVYRVFRQYGFTKRIRYIGSQIKSEEAMQKIEDMIPYFSLSLTVECFSKREVRMRKEKASLNMDNIQKILTRSLAHNFSTNYLYIVGLDDLSIMQSGVELLLNSINRIPIFQVMQNYVKKHENERAEAAKTLDYYLQARKFIEKTFANTTMKPRTWENYRSLFYTTYQNNPLECIKI